MEKLENEVLLSRRAALGAFATVALGTAGLLAGCGSDKATVTEDTEDGDKKEEAKKEEQSTTDLAVGATVTCLISLPLQAGCWPSMSLLLRRMGGEVVCPIKS